MLKQLFLFLLITTSSYGMNPSVQDQVSLDDIHHYMHLCRRVTEVKTLRDDFTYAQTRSEELEAELKTINDQLLNEKNLTVASYIFKRCKNQTYSPETLAAVKTKIHRYEEAIKNFDEEWAKTDESNGKASRLHPLLIDESLGFDGTRDENASLIQVYLVFENNLHALRCRIDLTINSGHLGYIECYNDRLLHCLNDHYNPHTAALFKTRVLGEEFKEAAVAEALMINQKLPSIKTELTNTVQKFKKLKSSFAGKLKYIEAAKEYQAKFEELYELIRFKITT